MLTSMSSGAILSKTRAMFGRRLTEEDYAALARKKDLSALVSYLSALPGYFDLMPPGTDKEIHRMELETLLHQRHYKNFESLCRYELSIGEELSDYILLSAEVELITESLSRILSPDDRAGEAHRLSPFLESKMKVDLAALGAAMSMAELLDAVKESVFHPVLKKTAGVDGAGLLLYENALLTEFYTRILATVEKSLTEGAASTLREMLISRIDLENLVRVARLRQHFGTTPDTAVGLLLPLGNVTGRTAAALADCKNSGEVLERAATLRPFRGKLAEADRCLYLDELPDRYILKRSLKEIHFSTYPAVVMVSYLYVSEIEVANIIRIIEGIRYSLSPERITELLIM